MKKICALLVAVLALVGLAACGGDKTPAETDKVKINIWATAAEEAVVKAVVDEYNASHEKKFEYEFTAISEADAGVTLANDPTVNGAPALFLCADDHISTLQSKNIVAEIKNARKDKIVANNTPVAVQGATLDGKLDDLEDSILEQTSSDITAKFNTIVNDPKTGNPITVGGVITMDLVEPTSDNPNSYTRITLGNSNNDIKAIFTNAALNFETTNGTRLAWVDAEEQEFGTTKISIGQPGSGVAR